MLLLLLVPVAGKLAFFSFGKSRAGNLVSLAFLQGGFVSREDNGDGDRRFLARVVVDGAAEPPGLLLTVGGLATRGAGELLAIDRGGRFTDERSTDELASGDGVPSLVSSFGLSFLSLSKEGES